MTFFILEVKASLCFRFYVPSMRLLPISLVSLLLIVLLLIMLNAMLFFVVPGLIFLIFGPEIKKKEFTHSLMLEVVDLSLRIMFNDLFTSILKQMNYRSPLRS